jgi:MoaA/NifB/PqqE/SkfB family radical SAM enzyme
LFTNGIAANRRLLCELVEAGLSDVAFHVDTTQRRVGYHSEADLNAVRREYIDRARGLPLMVVFNTTAHSGNFEQIPELVQFFRANSDVVDMISFQLQAETGRGEWGQRAA